MRLYTICVQDRPILVLSTGSPSSSGQRGTMTADELAMVDAANRIVSAMSPAAIQDMDRASISQTIDEGLGVLLMTATTADGPVWNGDPDAIAIRRAHDAEASRWEDARHTAIAERRFDAEEDEFAVMLIDCSSPS
jgi:hypothetical protein